MTLLNKIDNVIALVLFTVVIFCLFISFKVYRKRCNDEIYVRAILFFFLLVAIQLIIGFIGELFLKNIGKYSIASISLTIYIIPEFIIFSILLKNFITDNSVKKYLNIATYVYPIIVSICWILFNTWRIFFSVVSTIGSILILIPCLFYFYEILKKPPILKLEEEPAFWIVTGILFLFLIITPYYLVYKVVSNVPELVIIDYIAYMITVMLFTKSIICKSKQIA